MEAFKRFPQEFSECFKSCVDMLKIFNIRYLEDNKSFIKKYWRFFYLGPAVLIHLITTLMHIFMLMKRKEIFTVAQVLPPFLVSVQATIISIVIVPKTAEISTIIKDLGLLWRTKLTYHQSKERNKLQKRLNFWNRANYWAVLIGSMQFLASPMIETFIRKFILQQHCEYLFPVAATYPFDPTQTWFLYTAVYLFQSYTMFLFVSVYSGSELMLITLCGLLANEFMMLKFDLEACTTQTNNYDDKKSIRQFVKRHQNLIELSRRLDNVFNRMIFIDLLFVGITTCAFRFAGAFARGLTYTLNNYVGVTNALFYAFYVCYYCELLTRSSTRLADTAYQNLWYKGDLHYKKAMWLIIKISQKPHGLTSLKYTTLSLNTFTKVVSTTWSYFSLMNSVYTVKEE